VKLLVDNQAMLDGLAGDGMHADARGMGGVDHVKLAEEVRPV
jgi:hypothetical protein